ncbi:uncharacterized protein N7479_007407 [Penicillium vulpinum]|uniref:Uncharacterized protein n=1 Tax=Penicillium vulpinum TaxID=29845 RepID=A0A1V6SAM8_9EURO|nr:uncharacterized protein N7479_007407 [Penicillium vulpinum]KAJ5960257.1 hypothetical protein N7479_007407 [Penicillium vulpinum]OQE11102.1 hypothetical protein PENVUL_c003G05278 [Penicillium vulpinum]
MSDVEAVSLPAALDVGQNRLATVKPDPVGPLSPRKACADSHPRAEHDGPTRVHSEGEEDGPPSPRADSEAETIIQSGRESLSPEKKRKHIKHDPNRREPNGVDGHQRKKPRVFADSREREREPDRSPPPSRAISPSVVKIEKVDDSQLSETEDVANGIDRAPERPRAFRKRSLSDSAEEQRDHRRANSHAESHPVRELKHTNNTRLSRPPSNTRSLSPSRPSHARSASGSQFPKKKAPTPLLTGSGRHSSEDRQSTSSSQSGSPLPGAHLRKLSSGIGASASPAKQMGPKKLRDKSGRTPLARACADRKHDQVMMRHAERPEDINIPDNAGNTPLQIASLAGEAEIVKFLLEAGCEINTKNIDKDTPLIDAVENGNVEVVKLLLDAGANPRTVNAEGDEPYELVPSFVDDDEYEEMRKALSDAKANLRPGRRSEEHTRPESKEPSSRRASAARGSAASPRDSPPMRSPPPGGLSSRRKGGRSEATRNDLLWTKPTFENLREFAAKGDEAGVVSILNILQKADNASLIAAAKGGHHDVLSLLYAMGNADADPNPLRGQKPGYNTPMLAAIGRGNSAVIQLILNQPGFNPTRRLFEDRTYFELSRGRQGENWEDEYQILKEAYERFASSDKGRKDDSPRRARGKEKEDKRSSRRGSSSPVARKKINTSPNASRNRDSLKDMDSIKEKRRQKEHDAPRATDSSKPKSSLSARRDSESSGMTPNEDVRKRRLLPGRRPQERRPSLFSSDSLSGREEAPKPRVDTAPDNSLSLKRIRADGSPERSRSRGTDVDGDRLSPESRKKKRRVVSEDKRSGTTHGAPRQPDDASKPHPRRPHEDSARAPEPQPHKSTDASKKPPTRPTSPRHDPVKKNGNTRKESQEPRADTMEDTMAVAKRIELEAHERRRAQAKKAQEERAANEKRIADEAERDRLAKEEAERAAQVAHEKAEEEDRKRKEVEQRRAKQAEDDRLKRLELERARAAKMRRDREAAEHRRREALPSRLRVAANLVGSNNPRAKSHDWLKSFMPLVTALTRQLDPSCGVDVADEKWIPNYLVAPLLATNDLQLSQYPSWEKRKATQTQRVNLWRVTRRMLTHTDDVGFQSSSIGQIMQKDCDTRPKYFEMEHVFWIRLSDFTDLVPHIPHLHGLELQFLNMHVDPEPPTPGAGFSTPQLNGHGPGSSVETNGTGLLNGYGPSRSSTYV